MRGSRQVRERMQARSIVPSLVDNEQPKTMSELQISKKELKDEDI